MKLTKDDIGELLCVDPLDKPYKFIKLEKLREVVEELDGRFDNDKVFIGSVFRNNIRELFGEVLD